MRRVLESASRRITTELDEHALVLDVGGWAKPFPRADWVADLMPYDTRGLYGYERGAQEERFDAERWVRFDICGADPWPFADGQFDFAVCAHTLEDVRDPIRVCGEMQRVARAGYIECPSRLEEQSWGVHGPWVGWSHHRWLVDERDGVLRFAHKPGCLHHQDHFPPTFPATLTREQRCVSLWWEGAFETEELLFFDAETMEAYLREVAAPGRPPLAKAGSLGAPSFAARARRSLRRAIERQ